MLEATQNCSLHLISSHCETILSAFGIDWPEVTWSDMRRPLYSGLAMALYTVIELDGQVLSRDVIKQAQVWASMFNRSAEAFIADTASIKFSGKAVIDGWIDGWMLVQIK